MSTTLDDILPSPATTDGRVQLDEAMLQRLRDLSKKSFYFFAKFVLGYDKLVPTIHLPICRMLQDNDIKKFRIILPRGWFKTTIVSIAFPIWLGIHDPHKRILVAQNSHTNAVAKLNQIRQHFEKNQLLRVLYPQVLPTTSCIWTADSLHLNRDKPMSEGTFEAAGTRTKTTSRHYDVVIEDDTVTPDLDDLSIENVTPSPEDVAQAIGWHKLVSSLLVHPLESRNIVVGTRWAELDLLSWIAKHEPYFRSYERAVRERDGLPDASGHITWPERFSEEALAQLEASYGPYMFSCLYLNRPRHSDDMVFQRDWFQYYLTEPEDLITTITVDLAGDPGSSKARGKPRSDYNVVMTCGKDIENGDIFVLNYWRKRANAGEVTEEIFRQQALWRVCKVAIETVGYQGTFQYWFKEQKRKRNVYFQVEGITHGNRSKESRIRGLQPLIAAGRLKFRSHQRELISELEVFPLGAHDDLADALAMQLVILSQTRSMREEREQVAMDDPMSLDYAIKEMRAMSKRNRVNSLTADNLDRELPILASVESFDEDNLVSGFAYSSYSSGLE
jgi:predicted phage terminase large subunit-like protein